MNPSFKLHILPILALASSLSAASTFAASSTAIATADAFVATGPTGAFTNNNYGGGGALAVAAGSLPNGEFQSVIKFDLAAARSSFDAQYGEGQWSIQSVSLQLSSSPHSNIIYNDIAAGLFNISLMQNNSWVEGTGNASSPASNGITYSTLQTTFIKNATDEALGLFSFPGGSTGSNIYSLNLSSGLSADILAGGMASLRLFAADNNVSYLFSSRSMPAPNQPQLIITAVPEPCSLALFALSVWVLPWRGRHLPLSRAPNRRA